MELFSSFQKNKASDESRISFCRTGFCAGPIIGLAIGLSYGVAEWWFDRFGKDASPFMWKIHESFDLIVPITLGILAGIGINLYQRNQTLNQALSMQNQNLRSRLLANTLLAHILHEIRNPIHNLSALLEKSMPLLPDNDREIAERNLKRLNETAAQLKNISGPWDEISAHQRTDFTQWLRQFMQRSVSSVLHQNGIRYSDEITPFIVHMHPLLLEQCFTILFQNAIHACAPKDGRIHLEAKITSEKRGFAMIELTNNGSIFPEEVIRGGAKRASRSATGMGIGLLLARDTLENVGGTLSILNDPRGACVKLHIPAETIL